MIDEAKMANPSELSPRAAIALMSLQLRSTVHEAVEAEAGADAIDTEAALWQLRSRLAPLIEDRRRALEAEVAAERERAAAQIADAHAEADRVVTTAVEEAAACAAAEEAALRAAVEEAAARVAEEEAAARAAEEEAALRAAEEEAAARAAEDEAAARAAEEEAAAESPGVEFEPPELGAPRMMPSVLLLAPQGVPAAVGTPLFDDLMVEWPLDQSAPSPPELLPAPVTMPPPRVGPLMPPPPGPVVEDVERAPLHVVIDAESFARAFAAALAPALENRQAPYQLPPQVWMPHQAPAPKKSFWSHAWHPDVLLSGLAMVIVIIVLVAWTG